MRIIAGNLRGRLIEAPPGMTTRPMLDRVRQAVFNIIGAAYGDPGSIPPVAVLDVFAGSGALGMEALSRGATYCCFVEEDSTAARTLQGNLKALGLQKQAQVLQTSALKLKAPRPWKADRETRRGGDKEQRQDAGTGTPATDAGVAYREKRRGGDKEQRQDAGTGTPADNAGVEPGLYTLVFLDPPYPLSRDSSPASPIGQILTRLAEQADLDPSVLVVLRHEVGVHYDQQAYGRLKAFDVREYGGMAVTFMELVGG